MAGSPRRLRTLVVNVKGGCGKTTVATNLAAFFAAKGISTALFDHDPQGSSTRWLALRGEAAARVLGVSATQGTAAGLTRAYQMRVPAAAERIILDAPSGVDRHRLQELAREADSIIIPVLPSPLDMHVSAAFIQEALRLPQVRSGTTRLGIIANRVLPDMVALHALREFLHTCGAPLIATLSDDYQYQEAAGRGLGLFELEEDDHPDECAQWRAIGEWLDGCAEAPCARPAQLAH